MFFKGTTGGFPVRGRSSIFPPFLWTFLEHPCGNHFGAFGCHSDVFWLPFCLHFGCPGLQKWSPKCIPISNRPLKPWMCRLLHTLHYSYDPQGFTQGTKIETKSFPNWWLLQAAFLKLLFSPFVQVLKRKLWFWGSFGDPGARRTNQVFRLWFCPGGPRCWSGPKAVPKSVLGLHCGISFYRFLVDLNINVSVQ